MNIAQCSNHMAQYLKGFKVEPFKAIYVPLALDMANMIFYRMKKEGPIVDKEWLTALPNSLLAIAKGDLRPMVDLYAELADEFISVNSDAIYEMMGVTSTTGELFKQAGKELMTVVDTIIEVTDKCGVHLPSYNFATYADMAILLMSINNIHQADNYADVFNPC